MDMNNVNVKMVEFFDQHFYRIDYEVRTPVDGEEDKVENVTEYIPSVTTKLKVIDKPFLATWRGDIGNREADLRMMESQDRGSRLHRAWEIYTKGGAVIFNDLRKPCYTQQEIVDLEEQFGQVVILRNQGEMYDMLKLQKFFEIIRPIDVVSERTVYDLEMNDAGTLDNLFLIEKGSYLINGDKPVELEGGWYVFDLKTGNSIGEARLQVSAYATIAKKMGLVEPIVGAIVGHTSAKSRKGIVGFSALVLNPEQIESYYADYLVAADLWKRTTNLQPKVFEIPTLIYIPKEKKDGNAVG